VNRRTALGVRQSLQRGKLDRLIPGDLAPVPVTDEDLDG